MCISLMKIDFVLVMYMSKSMKVRIIFFLWKTREGELLFCFNTVDFMRIRRIRTKKSHKAFIEKRLSEKHFDQKI